MQKSINSITKHFLFLAALSLVLSACSVTKLASKKIKYKNYYEDSLYCKSDSDCQLYNCSSCGNVYWVEENFGNKEECTKAIPGLKGCKCEEAVCKRDRGK